MTTIVAAFIAGILACFGAMSADPWAFVLSAWWVLIAALFYAPKPSKQ